MPAASDPLAMQGAGRGRAPSVQAAAAQDPAVQRYAWRGRRSDGSAASGVIDGQSHASVVRELRRDGIAVIAVELAALDAQAPDEIRAGDRALSAKFRNDDVLAMCSQLSVMMRTGVTLTEALDTFRDQAPRPEVAKVVQRIRDDVSGGEDFSAALAKWPRIFPPIVIALMRAAEATGLMEEMLGRVAKDLAKQRRFTRQVKGAMAYPLVMLLVAIAALGVIMGFVLPKFKPLFAQQGDRLPAITKVLMAVAQSLQTDGLWWLIGAGLLVTGIFLWARSATGRRMLDHARLRAPIIKVMFRQLYVVRFANTMATLLAAGVTVLEAARILRTVTGNSLYDQLWADLEQRVERGQDISGAFLASPDVPRPVSAMIVAGERSGRLPEVLRGAADFAEEELDSAIKTVTGLIEPIMIVGMGVIVGGVAASILLPIFNLSRTFAH